MRKIKGNKEINIIELVDKTNKEKYLSKEEKLEKIFDVVYSRLWNINKKEEWEVDNDKTLMLAKIAEKKLKNSIYSRVNCTAKEFLF